MELFLRICEALKFAISLRLYPETRATFTDQKPDFEASLGQLPPDEREALEKRARAILEERTNPFLIISPMVHAKMLELLEADLRKEAGEEAEDEEAEDEEAEDEEAEEN